MLEKGQQLTAQHLTILGNEMEEEIIDRLRGTDTGAAERERS